MNDEEYAKKAQRAAMAESNKRQPEKNAALEEGIDAFKSGASWKTCPYKHTKPPTQAYDIKRPNAPFELAAGTKVAEGTGTIMLVPPPLKYEKAEAWKRGWLIAYWNDILAIRKNCMQKLNNCIRHIEALTMEYKAINKMVEEDFFKHFFAILNIERSLMNLRVAFITQTITIF